MMKFVHQVFITNRIYFMAAKNRIFDKIPSSFIPPIQTKLTTPLRDLFFESNQMPVFHFFWLFQSRHRKYIITKVNQMQFMSKSQSVSSQASQNNSLKKVKSANNQHANWIIKTQDAHDFSSVIQEVGDSFASGDQLLKQFEQYGIKIEKIDPCERENGSKPKTGAVYSIDPHAQRRHLDFDTVLDYSNIAKIKEQGYPASDSRVNRITLINKIKHIEEVIKNFQDFQKALKIQIQDRVRIMQESNQAQIEHYQKAVLDKISLIKEQQWREKQKLKQEIRELQEQLANANKERTQPFDRNRDELRSLRSLQEKTIQLSSQKQSRLFGAELLPSQSRYFANQLQLQYRKQSQIMKSLNAQIQDLTKETEELKTENKSLKSKMKQMEKQLLEKNQAKPAENEKSIQHYHKFLQKIKLLQDEINEMKRKEIESKHDQIQQWRGEIKDQLDEINDFLLICEERQRNINYREREIQKRQNQTRRLSELRLRKSQEEEKDQYELGERRKSNMYLRMSPQKAMANSIKMRLSTQPTYPFSQKLLKNTPLQSQHVFSSRPSMGGKMEHQERGNFSKYQVKNNDTLSLRLNKISSSIQSQLNSLRCKN